MRRGSAYAKHGGPPDRFGWSEASKIQCGANWDIISPTRDAHCQKSLGDAPFSTAAGRHDRRHATSPKRGLLCRARHPHSRVPILYVIRSSRPSAPVRAGTAPMPTMAPRWPVPSTGCSSISFHFPVLFLFLFFFDRFAWRWKADSSRRFDWPCLLVCATVTPQSRLVASLPRLKLPTMPAPYSSCTHI